MKRVYIIFNNTYLNEGKCPQIPSVVCEIKATAIRIANDSGFQDATIKYVELEEMHGIYYIPVQYVPLIPPTIQDLKNQEFLDKKQAVIDKALDAGLTVNDLNILVSSQQGL